MKISISLPKELLAALLLALLGHPTLSQAESMIDCKISEAKACSNCNEKISSSCSDTNNQGAFDKSYRPSVVSLKVINHSNGSERIVNVHNTKFNFGDLQETDKLQGLAKQSGIKLGKKDSVEVYQVSVLPTAKFYKSTQSSEIASLGQPGTAARSIASEPGPSKVGGVSRAQQMNTKTQAHGKDSK